MVWRRISRLLLVALVLCTADGYGRRGVLLQPEQEELLVVKTNDSDAATRVCQRHGYRFVRRVFTDEDIYLFRRQDERSRRSISEALGRHSEVAWASRQRPLTRARRSLTFNDPLFAKQWYLHNVGQTGSSPGHDIGVVPVWRAGITGRGVAIVVLDDGVHAHSDEISDNYESTLSEEYLFRKSRPPPVPENSHGTRCAAVAAGVANNGVCGVGVAYEAKVGGVRLLWGPLTDVQEALSLVHALDRVGVYTASWGPLDNGRELDGPRTLARMAFRKGVTQGRGGKGSIYVWAAGNGGGYLDHCGADGYASSPYTLTIGALTEDGRSAFYSEPCPALIASVYVGGRAHTMPRPSQWERDKERIKVVVPDGRGRCGSRFQGTSASAPMAAGVIALVLQANPSLSWRDVQHLIIGTSLVPQPLESGWLTNAAGFRFHPKVGSGALNARTLVHRAKNWTAVGPLRMHSTTPDTHSRKLPPERRVTVPIWVEGRGLDRLETVIATLNIRHPRRGYLEVVLQSPGGTESRLMDRRPLDNSTKGFPRWDFVTLHFWGEEPRGEWLLTLHNHHSEVGGNLDYVSLTLHGTGST